MTQLAEYLARWRRQLLLFGLTALLGAAAFLTVAASVPIPQTRVQSVTDGTVTGQGWDFPAGATFTAPPYSLALTVPEGGAAGDTLTVTAISTSTTSACSRFIAVAGI